MRKLLERNIATVEELGAAFEQVKRDASIRVVVLTVAGEKAFAAGADISEIDIGAKASAVHQPNIAVAVDGIRPEEIRLGVAVEITGRCRWKHTSRACTTP